MLRSVLLWVRRPPTIQRSLYQLGTTHFSTFSKRGIRPWGSWSQTQGVSFPFRSVSRESWLNLKQTSPSFRSFFNSSAQEADLEKDLLLEKLKEHAEAFPSDAEAQLNYVQELNRRGHHFAVYVYIPTLPLSSYPSLLNEKIVKEHIRAVVSAGHLDSVKLSSFSKMLESPAGKSPKTPLYVQTTSGKGQMFVTFLTILLVGGVIIYSFSLSRGGGGFLKEFIGEEYQPVERDLNITFKDVIGNDEAKEELSSIVNYLQDPEKFKRLDARMPKGLLLVGSPGCGKTLIARALAGEAGVPFFYASGSEFEEMLVGVGARRMRELFRQAKLNAPCVLFIDEIDTIGGRRENPNNRGQMTLNELLVQLDGFKQDSGVIVIAATNLPQTLDKALTRTGRFDRRVEVTPPDKIARKKMIEHYLGQRGAPDVDVDSLAASTAGFSGSDIFNMINYSAIEAIKRNLIKIPMRLLESAKETVHMGPERKTLVMSPETKKLTAYHESGHALVALHSPRAHNIVKATLMPRGEALGFVSYVPNDELLRTRAEMITQMDTAMGGRAAEEIIFGSENVTGGASSDFEAATRLATLMVTKAGMSEKVGHISIDPDRLKDLAPELQSLVESEIKRLLEESYQRAYNLIKMNEPQLHRLANALLEYETLSKEEIEMVVVGKDIQMMKEQQKNNELLLLEKEKELRIPSPPLEPEQSLEKKKPLVLNK